MKKTSISTHIIKRLLVLSIIIVSIAFSIAYYITLNVKDKVHKKTALTLQERMKERLKAKKSIGLTNAISLSSNTAIHQALKTNNRELAIKTLDKIDDIFRKETSFKNIKIHIHTKDVKSFVRIWKPNKYGDDLSSFRHTINEVKRTRKSLAAVEVGRAGMVIRGLAPIIDNGEYLGSLEFIQGYNSIAKQFLNEHERLLVLTDKRFVRKDKLSKDKEFGDFVITQKAIDEHFLNSAKKIDIKKLIKDKMLVDNNYLYTIVEAKDFKGNTIGYYLIGEKLSRVDLAVKNSEKTVYFMIIVMLIKTIIVILSVYYITKKSIGNGIEKFKKSFQDYVDYTTMKKDNFKKATINILDEIGQLLQILNESSDEFKEKLEQDKKVLKELAQTTKQVSLGDYSKRIVSDTDNIALATAKNNINKMIDALDKDMNDMKKVLDLYTHNDFRAKIDIDPKIIAEMRAVMESINALGEMLASSAKQNLENGEHLKQNASIMDNAVSNLATKANEQAASLEETAASIEEITSLTKNNTSHAIEMASLGEKLKVSANNGHKLANDTSSSMTIIAQETQKINDAINIIDQIAFQTNILSLNAAVEAATAGEAGKGFAVVAQEVRNLASRSAEAANEIKDLVETATSKADEGKTISDNMIKGYEELNEHINNTLNLIEDVTNSSKEQMQGIIQINDTINSLDQVTQENANETNNVSKIAQDIKQMAIKLVADASSKKF